MFRFVKFLDLYHSKLKKKKKVGLVSHCCLFFIWIQHFSWLFSSTETCIIVDFSVVIFFTYVITFKNFPFFVASGWNIRCMDSGQMHHFCGADDSCISWGQAQYGELGYGPTGQKYVFMGIFS